MFALALREMEAKGERSACRRALAAQLDSPRARMPSLRQVDGSGRPLPLTCEASFLHRLSSRYFSSFTCHFLMVNAREIPLFRVIGATRPLVFSFDGSMWIFRFRLVIICLWVRWKLLIFLLYRGSLMKLLFHSGLSLDIFYHTFVPVSLTAYHRLKRSRSCGSSY